MQHVFDHKSNSIDFFFLQYNILNSDTDIQININHYSYILLILDPSLGTKWLSKWEIKAIDLLCLPLYTVLIYRQGSVFLPFKTYHYYETKT